MTDKSVPSRGLRTLHARTPEPNAKTDPKMDEPQAPAAPARLKAGGNAERIRQNAGKASPPNAGSNPTGGKFIR